METEIVFQILGDIALIIEAFCIFYATFILHKNYK
jgi:hypothetical protein